MPDEIVEHTLGIEWLRRPRVHADGTPARAGDVDGAERARPTARRDRAALREDVLPEVEDSFARAQLLAAGRAAREPLGTGRVALRRASPSDVERDRPSCSAVSRSSRRATRALAARDAALAPRALAGRSRHAALRAFLVDRLDRGSAWSARACTDEGMTRHARSSRSRRPGGVLRARLDRRAADRAADARPRRGDARASSWPTSPRC